MTNRIGRAASFANAFAATSIDGPPDIDPALVTDGGIWPRFLTPPAGVTQIASGQAAEVATVASHQATKVQPARTLGAEALTGPTTLLAPIHAAQPPGVSNCDPGVNAGTIAVTGPFTGGGIPAARSPAADLPSAAVASTLSGRSDPTGTGAASAQLPTPDGAVVITSGVSSSPQNLLFISSDGGTLFATAGTTVIKLATTASMPGFLPDPLLDNPISAVVNGTKVYFASADSTDLTSAIWSYDGTTVAQVTSSSNYVDTAVDGNNPVAPDPMVSYGGNLIFSQGNLTAGADGGAYDLATLAIFSPGTGLITQPTVPRGGYDPGDFVTLNGTLYFEATDSVTHAEAIYSYNGTSAVEIYNSHPTSTANSGGLAAGAIQGPLIAFNGSLYFGSGQQTVYEITSTGSLANAAINESGGTNAAEYLYNNAGGEDLIVSNNHLFFLSENNGVYSVGTTNAVALVLASLGAQSFAPVVYNGALYFVADNPSNQQQDLYSSTGGAGTILKTNFGGSDFLLMGSTVFYNNNGAGLGEITGASSLGTLTVPGGAGGQPLVVTPFADVSWNSGSVVASPPTVVAGATVAFTGGGGAIALDSSLTVTDASSANILGAIVTMGSFLTGDTLHFTTQNGISAVFSSGTLTLSGTATVANYQTALDSITYSFNPANGDPTGGGTETSRTIAWVVSDISNSSTSVISKLNLVHAAPSLSTAGTVSFTGGGSAETLDGTLTLSDPDSGGLLNSGTVSLVGFIAGDILSANTTGLPITSSYNTLTGVLTLSGADTLADYQAALRSVAYSFNPANGDPTGGGGHTSRTIDWSINDGVSQSATGTSTLTAIHAAPAVTAGGTVSFTAGGSAVTLDPTLILADPDSAVLASATVTVGGFLSGDILSFTNTSSTTFGNIAGADTSGTLTLTSSGATATLAQWTAALRSIAYSFSSGDPTGGGVHTSRAVSWTVNDGVAASASATSTLAVAAAPILIYGQTIDAAGIVASSETVTAGIMSLRAGTSLAGTINVGTSLNSSDFRLGADGSGGTDVILSTVFGSYASNVTLLTNPATIASTAVIAGSLSSAIGVNGPTGTAWALSNFGGVSETGTSSYGISFAGAGGFIFNTGLVGGARAGIALHAAVAVDNGDGGAIGGFYGISASLAPATVVNTGGITGVRGGIVLNAGGLISNMTTGTISGFNGIYDKAGVVTVVNTGGISGDPTASNGLQLDGGGTVSNQTGGQINGDDGIFAGSVAVTVVNTGVILGNSAQGAGVYLAAGGLVSNQTGGTITGGRGVYAETVAVTVVNAGSIGGGSFPGFGIDLAAGGQITNQSGGTIGGGGGAVSFAAGFTSRLAIVPGAMFTGVSDGGNTIGATSISTLELVSASGTGTIAGIGAEYIDFSRTTIDTGASWVLAGTNTVSGSLVNSGTFTDEGTLANQGAIGGNRLRLSGGALTNLVGGVISAAYVYGISAGGTDTLANQATITSTSAIAVYFAAAGNVGNAAGASIAGTDMGVKLRGTGATVGNFGHVAATVSGPAGYGVYLRNGGLVANGQSGASTASIDGYYGVAFKAVEATNALGTMANYGTVIGSGTASTAVLLSNAGTVFNGQGGATAALIQGGRYGVSDGQGTVVNNATIVATQSQSGAYGVALQGAGGVSNLGAAAVIQGYAAVSIGTDGTVTNSGTIRSTLGPFGVAVKFVGGNARLIDEPGGVFVGTLFGGTGGTAVMELTSGAGTLVGFGTSIVNFTSLVFDSGARWTVGGNALGSGLTTFGGIAGFANGDTIDLTDFAASTATWASNTLVLSDSGGTNHATLAIQGSFASSDFNVVSDGTSGTDISLNPDFLYGATIDAGGIVAQSETVANGTLTLFNGVTAVGTVAVGTSLSSGDFTLASDGNGGTKIILSTVFGSYASGVTLSTLPATVAGTATISGTVANATGLQGATGTAWTVINQGLISETGHGSSFGVSFAGGGTITNAATAVIYGYQYGMIASGGAAEVSNLGRVAASNTAFGGYGIVLAAGGTITNGQSGATAAYIGGYRGGIHIQSASFSTVTNYGTVFGFPGGNAVVMVNGTVNNGPSGATGAEIEAGGFGIIFSGTGTVVNRGTISGGGNIFEPNYWGITIAGAGYVANLGSASLINAYHAVQIDGDGTVTNAGTIQSNAGMSGTAVAFGGATNLLIDHPGGVFTGTVITTGTSTLQLASGASAGTISGLGTYIDNFTSLTLDPGARWTVTGNASASGLGALSIGGFTFGDTIDLTGFAATGKTFTTNALVLSQGTSATATLAIQGSFTSGQFNVVSDGAGGVFITEQADLAYGQTIDQTGILATSETVTSGTLTLLNGTAALGTIIVGTSLSTGDLTVRPDGTGGTDVIVSSIFGTYATATDLLTPSGKVTATGRVTNTSGFGILGTTSATAWTLANAGSVSGTYGIVLQSAGTVSNSGAVSGTAIYGIWLRGGGFVSNAAGGTISAAATTGIGVYLGPTGTGSATNAGHIAAGVGIVLRLAGTAINSGTITASGAVGISLGSGGYVSNAATGLISAVGGGIRLDSGGAGSMVNAGRVTSGNAPGIDLYATGDALTNTASGTIAGAVGVSLHNGGTVINSGKIIATGSVGAGVVQDAGGTVSNAGTISATDGTAVAFSGTLADQVIDIPRGVFDGTVLASTSAASTTLELTSAVSAGTIAGIGTSFAGFGTIAVDPGAGWTWSGANTLAAGATLANAGMITDLGTLTASGTVSGAGTIVIGGGAAFLALGPIGGSQNVSFATGSGTLAIATPANFSATVLGLPVDDTFDFTTIANSGSLTVQIAVDDHLTVSTGTSVLASVQLDTSRNFGGLALAHTPDGNGGTDVTLAPPPLVGGTASGQPALDSGTIHPFATLSVTDANPNQTETVTVVLSDPGNGVLSDLAGGSVNNGTYTVSGTPASVSTALQGLAFAPTAHQVTPGASVATTFTLTVLDNIGVGTTNSATSVLATAANDPPTVGGTKSGQSVIDEATVQPFSAVSIADPDVGATETVTITLTSGNLASDADGTLSGTGLTKTGVGIYTLTTGSPDGVTSELDALTFTPSAHQVPPGGTVATAMALSVTDGIAGTPTTDTATTIIATAVNDAPAIGGATAGQSATDEATISPFSSVSIGDVDAGQTETVTITLSNLGNGALSGFVTGAYTPGTGVYSVTGADSAVTTAVEGLVFTPTTHQVAPGDTTTTIFTIAATDTAGGTASNETTTVSATAVNDPPAIGGSRSAQAVTDEASDSPFSNVSVGEVDFGQTETVTITLSNAANGALSNVGIGNFNGSTGVYAVSGTDAAVTSAMDGLVFTPTAHQIAPGNAVVTTFTIRATDTAGGTTSNSGTTVVATAVNDPPSIGEAKSGQSVTDEAAAAPFSGVTIGDADFGQTETVTVTLSNHANGTLSDFGVGGYNGSTGVYSVTGTDAGVTAAVDGLVFTPTAHQVAPGASVTTIFTIVATDTAGATNGNATTTVVATAVNDPPAIGGTRSGQTVTDETTISPFSGVTINDIDFGQTETVTITLSNHANGTLSNDGAGGYSASTGVYSVTGTDAAVTAAVDGLVFTPAAHQVVPGASVTTTFSIAATDTAGASSGNSTTTVGATAANDAPVIGGTKPAQAVTDETTISPFANVSIGDVDAGQTETVTITLSDHASGALSNGGGGNYNSSTGVYSVTGTDAAVTAAVDGLSFTPTAHQVAPGASVTTTFAIFATDTAGGTSSNTSTTVAATAINDPPVIGGTNSGQAVADNAYLSPFANVTIGDIDCGQTETVTITLSNNTNGTLSNIATGTYIASTGVYAVTGTDAAVTSAVDGLVFTPTAHQTAPGASVTTTFAIAATDTAGGTASNSATTVGVTAVNDPPAIAGTKSAQTVTDETTIAPFALTTIADPDLGASETITVTLQASGFASDVNGTLSGTGLTHTGAGTYVLTTNSPATATAELDALVFTPPAHQVVPGAAVTTAMLLSVTDGIAVTPTTDAATTVIATAVNDPPSIGGTKSGQSVTDETTIVPFTTVSIADVDAGQTETVTVTLSNHLNGSLSNFGAGTYVSATGVYSVTGGDAAVSAAVDALVFTPTAHQVAPGSAVTTTFTIAAIDTAGGTTSDSTTTLVSTAVNDAPEITRTVVNAGVPDELENTPFAGVIVTDPDVGHTDTVTVTLSNAAGGTLSNLGGGGFNAMTGVYTISGAPDAVTAALDALTFTPAPPADGFVSATGFTIAATGPGGTAGNSSISVTSVQQVLGLANTPTGNDAISVSADGTRFAAPIPDQTNQAAITQPASGAVYTLPTGYQAEFLGGTANATLSDSVGGGALLVGNTGNDTLTASAAADTILSGAGANLLAVSGARDVAGANGQTTVSASGTGDTVFGGAGDPAIIDSGTSNTIGLGSGISNVTLGGSGAALYGGTGIASILDSGTGDAIGGLTGDLSVTLSGGASSVFGGAGTLSVAMTSIASAVAIGTGAGNATLTIGGAHASVYGGSGSLSIDVTGDFALIGTGGGPASVTIGGAGATLYGGVGSLTADVTAAATGAVFGLGSGASALTLAGAGARVFGGTGPLTVDDLGTGDTISGGPGNTRVTVAGSGAVVVGGGGALSFVGGAGGATVFGGSGATTVTGGAGATTLYGGAGGIITFVSGAGLATYQAGSGNETLTAAGSDTGAIIDGGIDPSGGDLLIGGAGADSLFAGTGADTFTGGGGGNEFVFYKSVVAGSAPRDMITDFNASDSVILSGYGVPAAATALNSATSAAGATTITLSDSTRITFLDVSSAAALQGHVFSV